MTQHKVGSRDEWLTTRNELLEREQELNRLSNELAEQRRALPWVQVDKEYTFDTDAGTKTLAELFDGRSQLLFYSIMFGPEYTGACPGCTGLADHFDGGVVHLNHRDVTFLGISRDFGFAFTEEQMAADEFQQMINEPPDWLGEWAKLVGTDLQTGLAEGPGWSVFALSDGIVHHTYSRHAPDGDLLAPYYYQLLDQVPKGRGEAFRAVRRDEYEDATP
jgi:predicted dithiol-disulfide oxidoreductase (DUF899 family)